MVTRHGVEVAVLVSKDEWQRLTRAARPGLKELLLSDEARGEVPVPKRGGPSPSRRVVTTSFAERGGP